MLFSVIKLDNHPDTLANICLECIFRNLDIVFVRDKDGYFLVADVILPRELCESLLHSYQRSGRTVDDRFVNIFANKRQTSLQKATIWNSSITDDGLRKILQYNLRELDLAYCNSLTSDSFDVINQYGVNLKSLSLGNEVNVMNCISEEKHHQHILNTPNLTHLVLNHVLPTSVPRFYENMLLSLPKLTHLDLSCCEALGSMSYLTYCPNLVSLTLFNCALMQAIPHICQLTKLRHLDISQEPDRELTYMYYEKSDEVLERIIQSLPNLKSLDISGTNLAGRGNVSEEIFEKTREYRSDIPGLAGRSKNHLEFLGLYATLHRACQRHDIPAIRIAGDANEDQIITAGMVYMNRPKILQRVLSDFFHFSRHDSCVNIFKVLEIILLALNTYAQEKQIQISGSAALFYIVRDKRFNLLPQSGRNWVIRTLLNSMSLHINDETMLRNGCLTLCQFRIPQDILFVYNQLVELLLRIIMKKKYEGFVQRVGIYLMNSLACQVNDTQKEILGNMGIIQEMLTLIQIRIGDSICDEVLEVAWSTMWNVTDETPINCRRFLENGGMDCFIKCLKQFHEKHELMRNMMGLLGNVAEVRELRHGLMPRVKLFYDLLDSMQDGIEVSYNAAGVISHIASDGPELWWSDEVSREEVLKKMVDVIEKWNIRSQRNINYRSFEPILKLTRVVHTPACQHWAIWALANLTTVYPEKYCPILEAEGGLNDVRALINYPSSYQRIKELAEIVITNYHAYYKEMPSRMNTLEQFD